MVLCDGSCHAAVQQTAAGGPKGLRLRRDDRIGGGERQVRTEPRFFDTIKKEGSPVIADCHKARKVPPIPCSTCNEFHACNVSCD